MNVRGYVLNTGNCVRTFLKNNKPINFNNKPSSYVVRLNDRIKLGDCNNIYNRLSTYQTMYKNVEILHVRGFPVDTSGNYHKVFTNRLTRINGNRFIHDIKEEATIIKSIKDLTNGKFKILDMD